MVRMVRMMKWVAPVAGLALILGFNHLSKAADETPAPTGKATVNVTVVDKDGKGVENVRVRLMAAEKKTEAAAAEPKAAGDTPAEPPKKTKPKPVAEGTTDKDGKVALANVPDGDYTVNAALKGGGTGHATVKVEGGKDATVSVTLKEKKPKADAPAAEPK
jgi:hypothetical protein